MAKQRSNYYFIEMTAAIHVQDGKGRYEFEQRERKKAGKRCKIESERRMNKERNIERRK